MVSSCYSNRNTKEVKKRKGKSEVFKGYKVNNKLSFNKLKY